MNKCNFIKTDLEDTAKTLRNMNYIELPKDGRFWVFVNDTSKAFFNSNEVIYTNKINM